MPTYASREMLRTLVEKSCARAHARSLEGTLMVAHCQVRCLASRRSQVRIQLKPPH